MIIIKVITPHKRHQISELARLTQSHTRGFLSHFIGFITLYHPSIDPVTMVWLESKPRRKLRSRGSRILRPDLWIWQTVR
jgi:hypothetical protein